MYARIARYEIETDRLAEAAESFKEVGAGVAELDGFERGYVLVDQEDRTLMTVTMWSRRTALEASETRAGLMRRRAAQAVEGTVHSVHTCEVVAELGANA
jgi:heme-degrading monooxygenase HmoA